MLYNKDNQYTLKYVTKDGKEKELDYTPEKDMSVPEIITMLKNKDKDFFKLLKESKFDKVSKKIFNKGKQDGMTKDDADAIAASIGRKKYGKEKFQKMAQKGKKTENDISRDTMENKSINQKADSLIRDYFDYKMDLETLHDKLYKIFGNYKDAVEYLANNEARIKSSNSKKTESTNSKYTWVLQTNRDLSDEEKEIFVNKIKEGYSYLEDDSGNIIASIVVYDNGEKTDFYVDGSYLDNVANQIAEGKTEGVLDTSDVITESNEVKTEKKQVRFDGGTLDVLEDNLTPQEFDNYIQGIEDEFEGNTYISNPENVPWYNDLQRVEIYSDIDEEPSKFVYYTENYDATNDETTFTIYGGGDLEESKNESLSSKIENKDLKVEDTNKQLIWTSEFSLDDLDKEDLKNNQYQDYLDDCEENGEEPDSFEDWLEDNAESLTQETEEVMSEDLKDNVLPMIENQINDDVLILSGYYGSNYADFSPSGEGGKLFDGIDEFSKYMGDFDGANIVSNNNIVGVELYDHDGTISGSLYTIPTGDKKLELLKAMGYEDKIKEEYDEEDLDNYNHNDLMEDEFSSDLYYGGVDAQDFTQQKDLLIPIKNTFLVSESKDISKKEEDKTEGIFDKKDVKSYIRDIGEVVARTVQQTAKNANIEIPTKGTLMNNNSVIQYELSVSRFTGDMIGLGEEIADNLKEKLESGRVKDVKCVPEHRPGNRQVLVLSIIGPNIAKVVNKNEAKKKEPIHTKSQEEKVEKLYKAYPDEFDSLSDVWDIADTVNELYDKGGWTEVNTWFLPAADEKYKDMVRDLVLERDNLGQIITDSKKLNEEEVDEEAMNTDFKVGDVVKDYEDGDSAVIEEINDKVNPPKYLLRFVDPIVQGNAYWYNKGRFVKETDEQVIKDVLEIYKNLKSKKTEADNTSGTLSVDLNTGVLPIVDVDMYSMGDMINDFDVTQKELDDIVMETAPEYIEDTLSEILSGVSVIAKSVYHPSEYNFSGDELEFTLNCDKGSYESLKERTLQNESFSKFLKDNYSSHSGFISSMADNLDDFETQEEWKQVVQVIMFNVPQKTLEYNKDAYNDKFMDILSSNYPMIDDEDYDDYVNEDLEESKKMIKENNATEIDENKKIVEDDEVEMIDSDSKGEDMTETQENMEQAVQELGDIDSETEFGIDTIASTIDVLITDEQSAIDGYNSFLGQCKNTLPDELYNTIKTEIDEIIQDEEDHINKLTVIKETLNTDTAPSENTDFEVDMEDVDTVEENKQLNENSSYNFKYKKGDTVPFKGKNYKVVKVIPAHQWEGQNASDEEGEDNSFVEFTDDMYEIQNPKNSSDWGYVKATELDKQ